MSVTFRDYVSMDDDILISDLVTDDKIISSIKKDEINKGLHYDSSIEEENDCESSSAVGTKPTVL